MKTFLFFLLLIISTLFFSCQSVTGPITPKVYIPLNIGNYWVYDVNSKDSISGSFNSHIDSMVVIGITHDSMGEFYELLYFRDGFIYDTMKMVYNSANLVIYTKLFYPFIPLDTGWCQSSTNERLLSLAFNNINKIHILDTVKKDTIFDETSEKIYGFIFRFLDYDISKSNNIKIYNNNEEFNTTLFAFNGKEYHKIINQSDIPIKFDNLFPLCELLDDGKTLVRYNFNFNLYYQEGIGLIQSTSVMNRCNVLFSEHTRKLLRYKVN